MLTRGSNLTPQRTKNIMNDLSVSGTEVAFDIIKAGWLHIFLSFLPRPASCIRQVTPNGGFLPNTSLIS